MPTFILKDQRERQNARQSCRFRQNLQTNLNIEQDKRIMNNHQILAKTSYMLVTLAP